MGISTRIKNRGLRAFIWQACAFDFFNECVFIYSWYAVMFADHGLNAAQISVLFAAWSVTAFILEIPSGALADKYSRRHILAFAQVVKACGYLCWMVFPTFWGFLIGFVCWGVRSAFSSGTFEALVYDELEQFGAEEDYAKVAGRIAAFGNIGILISAVAAAPMIRLGYKTIILASMLPLALSCITALIMRPAKKVESTGESHYLGLLREGVREAVKNPIALRLISFISLALIFGALDEYYTLFCKSAGMAIAAIGIFGIVITAVQCAADGIAYKFNRLPDVVFYLAYLISGGLLVVGSYFMRPASAAFLLLLCFVLRISGVVMETRLQKAISGQARATVISVKGFAENVMAVVLNLAIGVIAHKFGYRGGFMTFGGAMVVIGAVFIILGGFGRGDRRSPGCHCGSNCKFGPNRGGKFDPIREGDPNGCT